MTAESLGELQPIGGGDPIPLMKRSLLVGRRESCDIVLRFANVSAHHCQLTLNGGYWFVQDLGSSNGVKVNGARVTEKRLDPGAELTVSKHKYQINYSPMDVGAVGPPPPESNVPADIMSKSLLERLGLSGAKKSGEPAKSAPQPGEPKRYDVLDNSAGQLKSSNRPF